MTYTQQLEQAYRTHNPRLVCWLQLRGRCCKATAEDIMGDTWLRIIQKKLPPDGKLVLKIAIDLLRSRITRERLITGAEELDTLMASEPEEQEEPAPPPINRLPPSHQAVVTTLLEAVRAGATHEVKYLAAECGISRFTVYRIRNSWKAKQALEAVK